jgi:hypothetical protein
MAMTGASRQRAYEKRRWTPYAAADAIALDVLPPAARKMLTQEVRRKYMLELIKNGMVPLVEIAQIDGARRSAGPKAQAPASGDRGSMSEPRGRRRPSNYRPLAPFSPGDQNAAP